MSSGMFRGKESSNRIELSRLVQDLLNFGVLGSLRLWGGGGWVDGVGGWVDGVGGWVDGVGGWVDGVGGCLGGAPDTCAHARAHTHASACAVNMIIPCKWLPPLDLGKSRGFPMMPYMHAHAYTCMCAHMCACVWGHPVTTPTHIHPPPTPRGDPWNQSKFNNT